MPAMRLTDHRWMSEYVCCRGVGDNCQISDTSSQFFLNFFFFYFSFLAEETQRYIGHQCIPATKSYLQEAKKRLG